MLTKRIIPCLDIKDGRTVKGTNFINLKDAGDPVELAIHYCEQGADELVFLDITATIEKRKTLSKLVRNIARHINIPFTVGGGINSIVDVSILLENGADKVSINTAAYLYPELIAELADVFGSQCIVVAIDAGPEQPISEQRISRSVVYINGGRQKTETLAIDWARQAVALGAGEILLTAIDRDGTRAGFNLELTRELSENLPIPVIASGGAGSIQHFEEVFTKGKADAALAAGIFHYCEVSIPRLKKYLSSQKIPVRL